MSLRQAHANREESLMELKEKVEKALDGVRPALERDGGGIELVDVQEGVAKVRLKGACSGCPGARMTLEMVVLNAIKEQVPEITAVEAVPAEPGKGCGH